MSAATPEQLLTGKSMGQPRYSCILFFFSHRAVADLKELCQVQQNASIRSTQLFLWLTYQKDITYSDVVWHVILVFL